MSYNIDTVEMIAGTGLRLRADDVGRLAGLVSDVESTLLDELGPEVDGWRSIKVDGNFWSGSSSGNNYEVLLEQVLPATCGSADIVFCWEGGDSFTGVRVVDGVVTEHDVVKSLGPAKTKAHR